MGEVRTHTLEELLGGLDSPGYQMGRNRAFAEVIRQGEEIIANHQNDPQDRADIREFINRFRPLAVGKHP